MNSLYTSGTKGFYSRDWYSQWAMQRFSLKMEDAVLNSHQTGEGTETLSITSQMTALNPELIAMENEPSSSGGIIQS